MKSSLICLLTLLLLGTAASAQSISLRLPDGSRWTGEVGDRVELRGLQHGREIEIEGRITRAGSRYLMVTAQVGTQEREFTFFTGDIRAIRTIEKNDEAATPERERDPDARSRPDRTREQASEADDKGPGVFVLPLTGGVGTHIIHQQVDQMAEYVDQYGPGQIIILKIHTPGGLGLEMERIAERLLDVRERHRLIAWVDEAISAGCGIISVCHEIYFMTDGSAGAMTPYNPATGETPPEEELREMIDMMGQWMQAGGRHQYFAEAMIRESFQLSYDVNPETGERTFHNDLSGEFVLVGADSNLTLNSRQAVHSGFADGIADNTDELARHLDLPRWREISHYGRDLHDDWHRLITRAEEEIPRLLRQRARTAASDPVTEISRRIQLTERLLRWVRRLPADLALLQFNLSEEQLQREISQMRRQLSQMR